MVGGSGNMEDCSVSYSRLMRIIVWSLLFIDELVCRSVNDHTVLFTQKTPWFLPVGACMTEIERQTPANCVVSPPPPFTPHLLLQFPFRKDQRIHVGNVNIVVPFVAAMGPSSSPFEMQNHNVFNFWGSPGRYLGTTQAWPAASWESSSDFNSAGPPGGPCGH